MRDPNACVVNEIVSYQKNSLTLIGVFEDPSRDRIWPSLRIDQSGETPRFFLLDKDGSTCDIENEEYIQTSLRTALRIHRDLKRRGIARAFDAIEEVGGGQSVTNWIMQKMGWGQ